ncbi:uncharacterized protein LOC129602574 [Paramacrobiotus metropolitanus]|uniref:uncharacterized protein LOC129602574 n=1 Tax=Paramacrobiotus metropolitanus TaxID=2943436 RepID=UPI002445B825|nr:uncharacterized protein LOC129602574 [Paramacrobiotus metropolitanus]
MESFNRLWSGIHSGRLAVFSNIFGGVFQPRIPVQMCSGIYRSCSLAPHPLISSRELSVMKSRSWERPRNDIMSRATCENLAGARCASVDVGQSLSTPSAEIMQSFPARVAEKLVGVYRKYGFTALTVHTAGAIVSLLFWWGLVASPVDVMKIFGEIGVLTPLTLLATRLAEAVIPGSLIIAYCLHKATAPLRWIITIALTPYLVRRQAKIVAP